LPFLLLVVISHVAEVVVAIDFLVYLGCLGQIALLEEVPGFGFEPFDIR
jgi:hypothetical protein